MNKYITMEKIVNYNDIEEICVVIAGSVDTGKTTTLSVLVNNELDNGKGSARTKIAKHPHEIKYGRTSDISSHNLYTSKNKRIILVDLCGHEKYLKTTISGMTGYFPDYGIVIVAANRGIIRMTKEHFKLMFSLKIPFIVLITRVDLAPKKIYDASIKNLTKFLKKALRTPVFVNSMDEFDLSMDALKNEEEKAYVLVKKYAKQMELNLKLVPIISTSNKSGYYINVLRKMLHYFKPRKLWEDIDYSMFYIESVYVPKGVGIVIAGTLKGKSVKVGSDMYIGPYNGIMIKVRIWSIHDNDRHPINKLVNKKKGCFALRIIDKKSSITREQIKHGMVVIDDPTKINFLCNTFKANIKILHHSTIIKNCFTCVIHCGTVKQVSRINLVNGKVLKTGDNDKVTFTFLQHPEFIEPGAIFIFREGTTKGFGKVTGVIPFNNKQKTII